MSTNEAEQMLDTMRRDISEADMLLAEIAIKVNEQMGEFYPEPTVKVGPGHMVIN